MFFFFNCAIVAIEMKFISVITGLLITMIAQGRGVAHFPRQRLLWIIKR